jgi:hypothetical protein
VFEAAWALSIALTVQAAGGAPQSSPPSVTHAPQAATWSDDRPITRFFPNLFHDVRALPSTNSVLVLGVGGAAAAVIHSVDDDFANWSESSGWSSYGKAGGVIGDGWVQVGAAFGTYGIGKLWHKPQVLHIGSDLIRAQALNALITVPLKAIVDRERPNGGHYAFPSGHTSATFASAATLHAHYGWKVGIPAYATAGFVAWTRARDGKHWLSDIAFGSAIGIVSGRTVAAKHGPGRVTITPAPTKGGGMVTITVQGRPQR